MEEGRDETRREEDIRRMDELLQELRVIIPGVQVIFAFLLTVAFTSRFAEASALQRNVYFAALMLTALATVLLTAPTAHHRLLWRQHARSLRLRTANALAVVGTAFLAPGICCVVFLVADVVYGTSPAIVAAAVLAGMFAGLWYLLPLYQRLRAEPPFRRAPKK